MINQLTRKNEISGSVSSDVWNADDAYPLDALVLSGDLTDSGEEEQWANLKKAFAGYNPAKNIVLTIGNHDTRTGDDDLEGVKNLFVKYNKEISNREIDNVYYSTKINGYSFIMLGSESSHTDAYFSDTQLAWLESEMALAAKDDKPIFVICHQPLNQTHGLPESWGDDVPEPDDGGMGDQSDAVEAILKKYDNVFLVSGHIHAGSSSEDEAKKSGFASIESDGSFHSINLPCYMYLNIVGKRINGQGFQFEVYDNNVVIRARSYSAGIWYPSYTCTIPLV